MLNEDKLKITITAISFMLVSFFVILTFNACKQKSSETTDPKAFDGVLDLRAWDFERKGPAALSLLQPDDLPQKIYPLSVVSSRFLQTGTALM